MNRGKKHNKINGLPAILFWSAVWALSAAVMGNPLLLPGPWQVLRCWIGLAAKVAFWQTVAVSIVRILLGVVGAVALGLVLAVAAFRWRLVEMLIEPAMTAVRATPVASFAILVLIWLDRDWVPVLICGLMVLPVIYGSVSAGLRTVDSQLLEMAAVYRLPGLRTLKRIWIPAVMPFFKSSCTNALGLGWKAGIAAEVLTVPKLSMGRMISEAKLYLMTEELFAWTLTVIVLSLLLQKMMLRIMEGRRR